MVDVDSDAATRSRSTPARARPRGARRSVWSTADRVGCSSSAAPRDGGVLRASSGAATVHRPASSPTRQCVGESAGAGATAATRRRIADASRIDAADVAIDAALGRRRPSSPDAAARRSAARARASARLGRDEIEMDPTAATNPDPSADRADAPRTRPPMRRDRPRRSRSERRAAAARARHDRRAGGPADQGRQARPRAREPPRAAEEAPEERVHPVPARQSLLRPAVVVGRDGPLQAPRSRRTAATGATRSSTGT